MKRFLKDELFLIVIGIIVLLLLAFGLLWTTDAEAWGWERNSHKTKVTKKFKPPKSTTEYRNIRFAEYLSNYDGDTITVNIIGYHDIIGKKISVRLAGIDTAEVRGKCVSEKLAAVESKRYVEKQLMVAERIMILNPDRDKYFRIVGDVYYDGVHLNQELLDNGMGYPYDGGTKENPWCD